MAFLRSNFAAGVLAADILAGSTSITVNAGHGLPTAAGTFRLVIWDSDTYPNPADDPNVEIVTAQYSGTVNKYNITRAQESTVAKPHFSSNKAAMYYTAGVSEDDVNWLGSYEVDETGVVAGKILHIDSGKLKYTDSPTFAGLKLTGLTGVLKATAGVVGGSATMDNIADGATYVRSENNLTDALKTNYDAAHTHISADGSSHSFINQNVTTGASPTFVDLTLSAPSNIYSLDHDSFSGFVGNEHIDHITVSIAAGGILSGGGDISANRTISLNHSDVDHNQTTNFVANEHINHTSVSITAGNGLTGGGDISTTRTLDFDATYSPSFAGMTITSLTASRLVASDGSKALVSSDLASWVTGTTNRVTVIDNGDGTITLSGPQDIHTGASPAFVSANISDANNNTLIGYLAGDSITSAENCVCIGYYAGNLITEGLYNLCIGNYAGRSITTGSYNFALGSGALLNNITGHQNVALGRNALYGAVGKSFSDSTAIGSFAGFGCYGYYNVFLGAHAGRRQTTASNLFILDSRDRTNAAGEQANALLYGTFGNAAADQTLRINGEILGSVGAKIGDGGTTDYIEIKADGEINLHGTARVKQAIWVDAAGLKAPGAKPATLISHGALEIAAWQFSDEGVEANQQSVSWANRLPEPMDRSTIPTITIAWSADGISPGNCEWQLEYFWTAPNESTIQGAEETLTQTTAASSTANGMVLTTFTGINVPSSSDVCLHCRLTRLSAGANDTIADTVELHGTCFQFTCDKIGEAT